MFERERMVTELLQAQSTMRCASILYAHRGVLVKERVLGKTLQSILISEKLTKRQIVELEEVIKAYRDFFRRSGFIWTSLRKIYAGTMAGFDRCSPQIG